MRVIAGPERVRAADTRREASQSDGIPFHRASARLRNVSQSFDLGRPYRSALPAAMRFSYNPTLPSTTNATTESSTVYATASRSRPAWTAA